MKHQKLRVSVVLCCYNGSEFVEAQVESVLNQSQPPDELMICDDASTDGTLDLIRRIAKQWSGTIRFIQNKRTVGFVKNFEKGITQASGDIVFLSDQDDVWLPSRLEKINEVFLKLPEHGMVFSDATVVNNRLRPLGYTLYSRHVKPDLRDGRVLSSFIRKIDINGCTIAFRTKFRKYFLPFPGQFWGHDHWITFIMGVISKIYMLDEPLMLYRRHSVSMGNDPNLERRYLRIVRHVHNNLSKNAYQGDYDKWMVMQKHLESLRGKGDIHFCETVLEDGIAQTVDRVTLAERRLHLRGKGRLFRVLPSLRLLLEGEYNKHQRGLRTFLKDLVA